MDPTLINQFPPQTVDKVNRLFDLLQELSNHPDLRGKLAMHGGTALNLFVFDIPRLSVDIDLSYVGAIDLDEMLRERPLIEQAIIEVAKAQGYAVTGAEGGHAGRTFVLNYRSSFGFDHVKIDCVYLNRSPLYPIQEMTSSFCPEVNVPMFDIAELIGGKVKAFFERVKIRDLYDICNIKQLLENMGDSRRVHKVILYYAALSAAFPYGFEGREERFATLQREFNEQLVPMLRLEGEKPKLEKLIQEAHYFIDKYVLPQDTDEELFLSSFAKGNYEPELLFENADIVKAALLNPEALWKLQNLKKLNKIF